MNKLFYALSLASLLGSCNPETSHEIYFDIKNQILYSCNNSPLRNILIKNDSVSKNGFLIEGSILLIWNDNQKAPPLKINLKDIPVDYSFKKGGIESDIKYFNLKANSSYVIEKKGGGRPSFRIKVWTDSSRNIYKTTHENCGTKGTIKDDETPDSNSVYL